jgi:hypothetical protein
MGTWLCWLDAIVAKGDRLRLHPGAGRPPFSKESELPESESPEHPVSRFRDMALSGAAAISVEQSGAGEGRDVDAPWVILIDPSGGVAAVVTREEASTHSWDALLRPPLWSRRVVVVAHPDSSVVNGISSWAFEQAGWELDRDVVVVVRDETKVWGVWHGPDLEEVLEIGTTRSDIDTVLPGDVHIPELVRQCGYAAGGVDCGATMTFQEYPDPAPQCPNPRGLADHQFLW